MKRTISVIAAAVFALAPTALMANAPAAHAQTTAAVPSTTVLNTAKSYTLSADMRTAHITYSASWCLYDGVVSKKIDSFLLTREARYINMAELEVVVPNDGRICTMMVTDQTFDFDMTDVYPKTILYTPDFRQIPFKGFVNN